MWVIDGTYIPGGAGSWHAMGWTRSRQGKEASLLKVNIEHADVGSGRSRQLLLVALAKLHQLIYLTFSVQSPSWLSIFTLCSSNLTSLISPSSMLSLPAWSAHLSNVHKHPSHLSYQLEHVWLLHIDCSHLICGQPPVPSLFPSLHSTQLNVSTHFTTCLCTSTLSSSPHLLFIECTHRWPSSKAMHFWMCMTTVLSSSWFLRNFSSHLFTMPTSN